MEPSGLLDSNSEDKSKEKSRPQASQQQQYFSLYDVTDEEVHFSRDMFNVGYNNNHRFKHQQYPGFSQLGSLEQPISASYFADVNLNYNNLLPEPRFVNENAAEQVKSSRLLNSIGSKLRRGSNYLIAPKLVGQYLLGITIQSWSEFFNTSRMTKAPSNTQQLTRRLLSNLSYFQGNYLCVSLVLVIYCILTSPLLLLAILAYLVTLYLITARSATGRHMRILNYRPNLQQQYSFITLVSIPLLWVAGAPSAVFWVIGASFVVVGLHASMYSNTNGLQQIGSSSSEFHKQQHIPSRLPSNTASQYYNHFAVASPQQHSQQQYLSIPSTTQTVRESSSYSNIFTHWIRGTTATTHSSSVSQPAQHVTSAWSSLSSQQDFSSLPSVSEFAGLGRVYEI